MFDFIDSEKYFSRNIEPYQLIKGEFDVCKPYFYSKQDRAEEEEPQTKKRKKNKISKEPSVTEIETEKRHEELRDTLLKCLQELPNSWPIHLKEKKVPCISNTESDTIDFPSIQHMVETAHQKFSYQEQEQKVNSFEFTCDVIKDLDFFSVFDLVCINKSINEVKLLQITPTAVYLIPPKSTFLMGSMTSSLNQLGTYAQVQSIGGADLIIMDPPWPNKSVKRSSHYDTQDIYDLYSIPMPKLMAENDCSVAIWVTNKPKFRNFIINKLFPTWKLECVGEWIWLKTTTQGECIFPIDSEHKKPYEQLIIGRPMKHPDMNTRKSLPRSHTLISVPSVRHSRKPPLEDVLLPYINKKDPVCLELFARHLSPGWISWGNECLKFQHLNYFDKPTE